MMEDTVLVGRFETSRTFPVLVTRDNTPSEIYTQFLCLAAPTCTVNGWTCTDTHASFRTTSDQMN